MLGDVAVSIAPMQACYEGPMRNELVDWGGRQNAAFVEELTKARARFLIVGGTAVNFHMPCREARDLDLLLDPHGRTPDAAARVISRRGYDLNADFADWLRKATWRFRFVALKDTKLNVDLGAPPDDFEFGFHWSAADEIPFPGSRVRCRVAAVPTLLECLSQGPQKKHARDRSLLRALIATPQG